MTTPEGTPKQGLAGATLGFFVGFAAVALFGPMAQKLQAELSLSPAMLGLAVAAPLLGVAAEDSVFCLGRYHRRTKTISGAAQSLVTWNGGTLADVELRGLRRLERW